MTDVYAGEKLYAAHMADHESRIDTLELGYVAYRSSDSAACVADATVNDDTQLVIAVPATGVFAITGLIVYSCTSQTPDLRFAWGVPAGATIPYHSALGIGSSATSVDSTTDYGAMAGATTEHGRGTMNGEVTAYVIGTLILGGTAGYLTFRWSQINSNAAGVIIKAGSWLTLRRLA